MKQNRTQQIPSFSDYSSSLLELMVRGLARAEDNSFNQLALQLFKLQFEQIPPFRRWCQTRRMVPDCVSNWRQIPAMPTAAFKELDLSSLPMDGRSTMFCSSGTTRERPSRHFHNAESLAHYEASIAPWFQAHLLPELSAGQLVLKPLILCALTPSVTEAPQSSLVYMFDTVRRRFAFSDALFLAANSEEGGWKIDLPRLLASLRELVQAGRPVLLAGAAFSYLHLLDYLVGSGERLRLPGGSRALETGGYKGRSRSVPKAELHSLITERLGIPPSHLVSEYGMCELSSQAYDAVVGQGRTGPDRVFRFPPWARAEVVSPETGREVPEGEIGLLRVVDLANVYSVLAVQTEDLAIKCGGGFTLLGRAEGAEARGCSLQVQEG